MSSSPDSSRQGVHMAPIYPDTPEEMEEPTSTRKLGNVFAREKREAEETEKERLPSNEERAKGQDVERINHHLVYARKLPHEELAR